MREAAARGGREGGRTGIGPGGGLRDYVQGTGTDRRRALADGGTPKRCRVQWYRTEGLKPASSLAAISRAPAFHRTRAGRTQVSLGSFVPMPAGCSREAHFTKLMRAGVVTARPREQCGGVDARSTLVTGTSPAQLPRQFIFPIKI
jgi:hypothetical protein